MITLTSTLIIPDITKTSSNNCLWLHCFHCLHFSGHAAYGDAVKLGNLTTDKYYVQGNTGLVMKILRKDSSELMQQDESGKKTANLVWQAWQ